MSASIFSCSNNKKKSADNRHEYLQIARITLPNDIGSKSEIILAENDSEASIKAFKNIEEWKRSVKLMIKPSDSSLVKITSELYDEHDNEISQKLSSFLSEENKREIQSRLDKVLNEFEQTAKKSLATDSLCEAIYLKNANKIAKLERQFRIVTSFDRKRPYRKYIPKSSLQDSAYTSIYCNVEKEEGSCPDLILHFTWCRECRDLKSVQFVIDGRPHEIIPNILKCTIKSEKEKNTISSLITARSAKIKFVTNSSSTDDAYVSSEQIESIKQSVELYRLMGGKL